MNDSDAAALLHICCAPCGGGCAERMISEGRPPLLYYSNSNLESREEFDRRLESVVRLARHFESFEGGHFLGYGCRLCLWRL